jgi:WD40 repeat protein
VIFTGNYTQTPASSTFLDRSEVWIADSSGQHRVKLFEGPVGGINQVVWLKDETKVIFDFGYEGGVNLFIADVASGKVVPLSDMSDFKRGTDQLWAVSPDGNYLAVIGGPGGSLWIISLEDGKTISIDSNVQNPFWSQDGTRVYYWWGPSFEEIGTLRAYDVTSKRVSTIISKEALTRIYPDLSHAYFAVAPADDKAIFWGPHWLWVVKLKP